MSVRLLRESSARLSDLINFIRLHIVMLQIIVILQIILIYTQNLRRKISFHQFLQFHSVLTRIRLVPYP